MPTLRALTFDLDDTLWPIAPAIARAEQTVHAWLAVRAPRTADRHSLASLRSVRAKVIAREPARAYDLRWVRRQTFAVALEDAGDDPALADAAFEIFDSTRQQVALFDDVLPALAALSRRFRLAAISNGFADIDRIGIGGHFAFSLSAVDFGVPKPHAAIFHAACERLGCAPDAVLHVGDDAQLDVLGAQAAGLRAAWINRAGARWPHVEPPHAQFTNLEELVRWLSQ